jgi:glycerate-2-kinase
LIANRRELARFHSDRSSKLVLAALEAAVESVMPDVLVKRAVEFDGRLLIHDIHGSAIRLKKFERIFVVGAGKAAAGMASTLCSILRKRVTDGAITVPNGINAKIKGISVTQASHPMPDSSGLDGTKKILNVLSKARKGDLVFILISGGGSALMPLPAPGISLADKQKITDQLLRSGASIQEMNVVRKHLSAVKGGQLLRYIDSSCTVVSLIISDVVGDDLGVISSSPTYPDSSTFQDALQVLKRFRIKYPDAALEHVVRGSKGEIEETPKAHDPTFSRVHNVLIGNNAIACTSALNYFEKRGIRAVHLGSEYDGEAKDFGRFIARLASDLGSGKFAIVAGGESTVRLNKSRGVGGRNQEAALACLTKIRHDVSAAFMGTDGKDGNSDAAGALVSPKTVSLAKRIDLQKYLLDHDSYSAFKKLNSLIFTGYTGTNVNDIAIVCKG